MSGEQARVNDCQLLRDNGGVLSKKEGSKAVLSNASEEVSRSKRLQSERRLIGMYIGVDQD